MKFTPFPLAPPDTSSELEKFKLISQQVIECWSDIAGFSELVEELIEDTFDDNLYEELEFLAELNEER